MQPPTNQLTGAPDVTDSRDTPAGGLHQRIVSQHTCNQCSRPGKLVSQNVIPRKCTGWNQYVDEPWVFRYWLCQWHLAAWNRKKMNGQKKMIVLQWKPDEEVLANAEVSDTGRAETPSISGQSTNAPGVRLH